MSGLGFDNIVQPTIAQKIVDQILLSIPIMSLLLLLLRLFGTFLIKQ